MAGREVKLISDRDLARKRLPIWAGSRFPHTIVIKELIDNEVDVINESSQKANEVTIMLGPNRIKLMDNGDGISVKTSEPGEKPSLWLACAKMFSSSNYDGVSESVGANGVGMTMANFTSFKFNVMNFNGPNVKGYMFTDGFLNGTDECIEHTEAHLKKKEYEYVEQIIDGKMGYDGEGDFVEKPLSYEEANEFFKPMYEHGFLVDATWHEVGNGNVANPSNKLFSEGPDLNWLTNYTHTRMGEVVRGKTILKVYATNNFEIDEPVKTYVWHKNKDEEGYVKSWAEKVKDHNGVVIKNGPWQIGFSTDENMNITSVVQGAPVESQKSTTVGIEIQNELIKLSVPITFRYLSEDYPPYQDQTKVQVRFPHYAVGKAFERSGSVYKYFYQKAVEKYTVQVIAEATVSMYWPCSGPSEEAELIIAEGYSAISGLKSMRDPKTQACIALKGKILNVRNMPMEKAMNSDVVKQVLNAVLLNNYKRIIIAVDADDDGGHIASLLISMFYRFTNVIQEGKLFYVHTPHYIFKKRNAKIKWSDDATECPAGYHVTTLKGLGGMEPEQVGLFIMNADTRDLVRIDADDDADASLDLAFTEGGKPWIIYEN